MVIDEIIDYLGSLDGVLILRPGPGDGSPEIAWGDTFFYYSPTGVVPKGQPFATIVTKNYPGDEDSQLDRPDTFRVNMAPGKDVFAEHAADVDPSVTDTVIAHPVYGGWLAVVNPGPRTDETTRELLRTAYDLARSRYERRAASA
jgi:hypothetical protein